jgi:hypothetical protein
MKNIKYLLIALILVFVFFGVANINLNYINCMKATKHSYISKAGADHISAICEAFIKEEVMVK